MPEKKKPKKTPHKKRIMQKRQSVSTQMQRGQANIIMHAKKIFVHSWGTQKQTQQRPSPPPFSPSLSADHELWVMMRLTTNVLSLYLVSLLTRKMKSC